MDFNLQTKKDMFKLMKIIFIGIFFSNCSETKIQNQEIQIYSMPQTIQTIESCFDENIFLAISHVPSSENYWRARHSNDGKYFTSRSDYAIQNDLVITRTVNLKEVTNFSIERMSLPLDNAFMNAAFTVQEQKEIHEFGWLDQYNDKNIIKQLKSIKKYYFKLKDTIVKNILPKGTISFFYRNDTLKYIESKVKQKNEWINLEFLINDKYLYIYQRKHITNQREQENPLKNPSTRSQLYPVILLLPLNNGYLFKNQIPIVKMEFSRKLEDQLEPSDITFANQLIDDYYLPILSLINQQK
jgi:hypothetical protein